MEKATIITIGDELLIGQVVDTNSAWLGAELTKIGFAIDKKISISDNKESIKNAVSDAFKTSDLIFVTGGLGPTKDDITKKVLSDYFNAELIHSNEVLKDVEAFIRFRGSKMNKLNHQQALVPNNAIILNNKQGTAPGMWFNNNGKVLISVPGVPSEMKGIFEQKAKGRLVSHFNLDQIIYKTVLLTGIAEAHLAEKIQVWEDNLPVTISIAYLPSPGIVRLRLGIKGENRSVLEKTLEKHIKTLQSYAAEYMFGYNDDSLPKILAEILKSKGASIATAESCTGGNLAHELTLIPGSSAWYKGSIVAYHNSIKEDVLGVAAVNIEKHGAVSRQVVEEMAIGVKKKLKSTYSIATSGIAGPEGGSIEKPVGTVWVGIAGPGFVKSKCFLFGKDRSINIRLSTFAALNFLRKEFV